MIKRNESNISQTLIGNSIRILPFGQFIAYHLRALSETFLFPDFILFLSDGLNLFNLPVVHFLFSASFEMKRMTFAL